MLSGMLVWLNGSKSVRRPKAVRWGDMSPEVLEVRAVPVGIDAGTYHEIDPVEGEPPETITVFPSENGQQRAIINIPGLNGVPAKVVEKKNGAIILKIDTRGVHGKVTLTPAGQDGFDFHNHIHAPHFSDLSGGTVVRIG